MSMLNECVNDLLIALSKKTISMREATTAYRMWVSVMESNGWDDVDIDRGLNFVSDHKDVHYVAKKLLLIYLENER